MSLLTTPEVADRLGVTVTRVQQMIAAGRLPAEKMGRDYFIKEEDLALVKDRKAGRPPKAQSTNDTARPVAFKIRQDQVFREATEAKEMSKKKAAKRGKK